MLLLWKKGLEFQIQIADRANQVLPLYCFFTSFKCYDFLKFVKINPLPFVDK